MDETEVTEQQGFESLTMKQRRGELVGRRGSWMMEDTVGLCDSDVIHRSKSQIILFYAHMNKANGAGKICKLLSNWPVSRLKPCQTTVREGESRSERTQRITGLVSAAIHSTFH